MMKLTFWSFLLISSLWSNSALLSQNNDTTEYNLCDSAFLDMMGEVVSNQYSCEIISEILELEIFQEYLDSIDTLFPRARIVNLSGDFLSGICPCHSISIVNRMPVDLNTRRFADMVFDSVESKTNYRKYTIFFNRIYDQLFHNVYMVQVELERKDGSWKIDYHYASSIQTGIDYSR